MIGILAGMGPKSTGPFVDQVVTTFQSITGARYDIDFPPMMIYSLPTPFYLDRPLDHSLMEQTICTGLKKLASCGVSFIAMPCNTAHLYFKSLENCISLPLLNMVDITVKNIPSTVKKVAILGTTQTLESQIYQKKLEAYNIRYLHYPEWQEQITSLLKQIKEEPNSNKAFFTWEKLSQSFKTKDIDTLLIVCTDLNQIFNKISLSFHFIDASACLAKAIVQKWNQLANY